MRDPSKYYQGKVCKKHPELKGMRAIGRRACTGCERDRTIIWREKHKEYLKEHISNYRKENKEALKEKAKDRYWSNRESVLESNKSWRDSLKEEVISRYGGECVLCGIKDIDVLCIDHTKGGGNKHRKTTKGAGSRTYSWLKKNDYPAGYRTLCCNCNLKEHLKRIRQA